MKTKPTPGGPFAPVNDPQFRRRIADALGATEGVTLPPDAAEALAAQITDRAADLITKRDKAGTARIRPERLRRQSVGGDDWVLELRCMPTFNVPWWHNLRVEHRWADSSAPARPWPIPLGSDTGSAAAALVTRFRSVQEAQDVLRWGNETLRSANSDPTRGYSLAADLARNGQEQPGCCVLHAVVWDDDDGVEQVRYLLANVLGNSRAMYRLDLLNVRWEEAVFGLRLGTLRAARPGSEYGHEKVGGSHVAIADPAEAWNRLMAVYETLYERGLDSDGVPEGYEAVPERVDLQAAARLASAPCWVVVGVSDPSRTLELVQRRNLRDHLRGNQELEAEARYLAMGAEVIDAYCAEGRLPAAHAPAVKGAVDPGVLAPGGARDEAEGVRRAMLQSLLFPTDDGDRRLVAAALGEPTRKKDLRSTDTDLRSRVLTALVTRGQLNSRVGEVFSVGETKDGVPSSGKPLLELVADAAARPSGGEADELLGFHALVALGEAGIYEADRGSSSERREPRNVKQALLRDRVRAVGLVGELLRASASGRHPRQVGEAGEAVPDSQATREWFNQAFPKRAMPDEAEGAPPYVAPPASPEQRLQEAMIAAAEVLATGIEADVGELEDRVGEVIALCNEHDLKLDMDWIQEFSSHCAKARNRLMDANRHDELVRIAR